MRFCNFYKQLDPDESELTREVLSIGV